MPVLDYTSATGVFRHLGALIARINSYQAVGNTTLPADLATLVAAFGTTWLPPEGIASHYEGLRDSVTGWRVGLASFADRRITDFETVLKPLLLPDGSSVEDSLLNIRRAMRDDAQTVRACLCGVGSPSYHPFNRGNGRAWTTTTLDGYNAPVNGGIVDVSYDGQATQLTVPSETMTLECVADSVMNGMPEGGESWRWTGSPDHGPLDVRAEGSGEGPGLRTTAAGDNLLSNPSLDTWSGATISGWSATGPVSRSAIIRIHGEASAQFAGAGTLRQAIRPGSVQGRRRYFIGFSARSAGAALPGARVELRLEGTGFAPGAAQIDGATLSGSWSHAGVFVTLSSPVPADLACVLEVVNPASATIYVDALSLTPAVYHGGLAAAVTAGFTPWQTGDRIAWSVTNDQAGKFQSFFRRWFRCQLPCITSGTSQGTLLTLLMLLMPSSGVETISESLVA